MAQADSRAEPSAGVVLAGGRSSRMGAPKAALDWHGSTLLRHITGVVGRAVDGPVVVVRAPGQALPELAPDVLVTEDPVEGRGPMQGIAAGLAAASGRAAVAFVCSTDLPFLHTAFIRAVLRGFGPDADGAAPEVVLPFVGGFRQPTAAGYRTALAPRIERLLAEGRLRPAHLFEESAVRWLDDALLRADPGLAAADPGLDSVVNANTPEDYAAALGRPAPEVRVERVGPAARGAGPAAALVRAANLAAAARQAGVPLGDGVAAEVNGDPVPDDGMWPLLAGDTVTFRAAADGRAR